PAASTSTAGDAPAPQGSASPATSSSQNRPDSAMAQYTDPAGLVQNAAVASPQPGSPFVHPPDPPPAHRSRRAPAQPCSLMSNSTPSGPRCFTSKYWSAWGAGDSRSAPSVASRMQVSSTFSTRNPRWCRPGGTSPPVVSELVSSTAMLMSPSDR